MAPEIHRLKILIIAPQPPPYGGMAIQAQQLFTHLRDEGVEVTLIKTNQDIPKSFGFILRIPGFRALVKSLLFNIKLLKVMPNGDIIYSFGASYLFFFLHTVPTVILARIFGKKVFINYRGGAAEQFLKKWGWLAKIFIKGAHGVTVPSKFLQEIFAKFGIKTMVVPNIVDISLFHSQSNNRINPRLLVARHLEEIYNVGCVIRAFQIVKRSFPDAILGIAGEGSQLGYLKRLAEELNLADVYFYGFVPHSELPQLYAKHDIYVNGSNVDNFPGAIMEAFASGLPVVTTKAGGIPYIIDNGRTGLLVELDDYKDMAGKIISLVKNPEFALEIAKNARKECEQYSWDNIKNRLFEVIV